jgi:hypothetical protein
MRNTPKDMRSFVQEVRVLLTEEQDHRRRVEDLRPYRQMAKGEEKPVAVRSKEEEELAEAVR